MSDSPLNAKERILQAAIELLAEFETITVRQIAERAEVGIGSINYHFQSKDNLLNEAVGRMMGDQAARWYEPLEEALISLSPSSSFKSPLIK